MQHIVSTNTLIKASISAIVIATLTLVLFILPAEYNIDPTGIGHKLGLTTIANADEVASMQSKSKMDETQSETTEFQTMEVTVPAGRGIEYKFAMPQYAKMTYEWITDGEPLYFDLHGEPDGDTTGYFESYVIATSNEMKGSFTAPFAGSHGWYWKNTSEAPVSVQLMVKGEYTVIGLKK